MRSSNFILVKQFYTAMGILENLPLFQEQVPLIVGADATPSFPLMSSSSHAASQMMGQMRRWLAIAFNAMINPATEITRSAETKSILKRQRLENYLNANQAELLPLLLAYIKQHLPHLEKSIQFSTNGSIQGRCIGFAVTLAEAIAEDQLDTITDALGYLVMQGKELKSGQSIVRHKQLDSIITSIVKKQSNSAAGPVINIVKFDGSVFSDACQKMVISGETLVFGSNYGDEKRENHAIAVTLRIRPGNKRQYYLIDANGTGSKVSDSWQSSCAMVAITDNPAKVQEFVTLALNLLKGMTVFIHALPLNPVISRLMAKDSPDSLISDVLASMLYPILYFFPKISSKHFSSLLPKTGIPALKTYRRTLQMIEAKTMGALTLGSPMLLSSSLLDIPVSLLNPLSFLFSLGGEELAEEPTFSLACYASFLAFTFSIVAMTMQRSTLRSPAPTTASSLSDEPIPPALTLDSAGERFSFSHFFRLCHSTRVAGFQSDQKVLTMSMRKGSGE